MKLNLVRTIGGNLFYLGDSEDEDAPMVEVRFWNEFAELPKDGKDRIAAAMFDAFMRELQPSATRGAIKDKRVASSPAAQTPEVLTQIPVRKQCSCGDPRCNYDNYWSKKHAREARSGAQTEPSPAQTKEK